MRFLLLGNLTSLTEDNCKAKEIRIRSKLLSNFPKTRKLLSEARAHNESFAYVWETRGKVLMKKTVGLRPIHIISTSDNAKAVQGSVNAIINS